MSLKQQGQLIYWVLFAVCLGAFVMNYVNTVKNIRRKQHDMVPLGVVLTFISLFTASYFLGKTGF